MGGASKPKIGLVWTQLAPHHIDRCIALARRLDGRAQVLVVEVASSSKTYADWAPSGEIDGVRKITLFPGEVFEQVSRWRRFRAMWRHLSGCRMVCIGVPYSEQEVVLLAWLLRIMGKQTVLMIDSKFDDRPRSAWFELCKQAGLFGFGAAIFAGTRTADYLWFLGFRRRTVLPGYDGVSLARIRDDAAKANNGARRTFAQRDFLYVGRLVDYKNPHLLLQAFARYVELAGPDARRLIMAGSGPLGTELHACAHGLGIADRVDFVGFKAGPELAGMLADALSLVLPSYREQWGLVVNEALALGLPVIVSNAPGARDVLVRNLINGYVIENGSCEALARAMFALGQDEAGWIRMSDASLERAPLGDCACFADAVELFLDPAAEPAASRVTAHLAALQEFRGTARE